MLSLLGKVFLGYNIKSLNCPSQSYVQQVKGIQFQFMLFFVVNCFRKGTVACYFLFFVD